MMTQFDKIINNKRSYYCIVVLFFILFMFLHFYNLTGIPASINIDEAGLWYNVKCLSNWGIDQGENSWPLLFTNYYGEQSAMYTYLAFICVKIFGDTLLSIRLPAAICSCLIFIFGYKIINHLYKSNKINLLFCLICTISPYFISTFRIALDCNLMLCFSTVFFWLFIKAIETKRYLYALLAGVFCGLTLYTYGLSYVIMPLFLVGSFIYLIYHKKINIKQALCFTIPVIVLATPLIAIQVINLFDLNEVVIGNITLTKFLRCRSMDFSPKQFVNNILYVTMFILFGGDMAEKSFIYTNFYPISTILIMFGIVSIIITEYKNIKTKTFSFGCILSFWGLCSLFAALMITGFVTQHQSNAIYFIILWLIIEGIVFIYRKLLPRQLKQVFIIFLVAAYVLFFALFTHAYFCGSYNEEYYQTRNNFAEYDFEPVINNLETNSDIVITIDHMYYKLITDEHPSIHPHKYELKWSEELRQDVWMENLYSYDNNMLFVDRLELYPSESIKQLKDTVIVISRKDLNDIGMLLNDSNYVKIELDNYIIYTPK